MGIYKGRAKGTHRIVVWAAGRRHEEVFAGSKVDAREHEARMRIALGAQGQHKQRLAPNFSDFCRETYAPFAVAHLGKATWRVRRFQIATLVEHFGGHRLTELSNELVDEFKAARLRKVRASSVNNELRVFKTMLKWASEERSLPVAALKIRRVPVPGDPRVKAWTAKEVGKIFASARKSDAGLVPLLEFLFNTGCRKGEAIAAEWSWIDEKARVMSIPVTEFWKPKNGRPREVPIGDALRATLRALPRATRWLFPNLHGERYAEFPNERFRHVVQGAKLTGGPHKCRHTYATLFLRALPDLHQLAGVLGHSQTRVTELYTHLLPGHLDRARNAVNLSATVAETVAERA